MFNETLLEEGYAQVYIVDPNDKYEERFDETQAEAQVARRGMWGLYPAELALLTDRGNGIRASGCTHKATPQPPPPPPPPLEPKSASPSSSPGSAAQGKQGSARIPAGGYCPPDSPIKGNHSSSGELIYHVPGGQFYNATNPEECFANEDEAQSAGY